MPLLSYISKGIIWIKKTPASLEIGVGIETPAEPYSSILLCTVPSAIRGLTSEFGMGSGITLSQLPARTLIFHQ